MKPINKAIRHWLNQANKDDKEKGINWYHIAHEYAVELADKYELSVEQTSGVISALSPSVSWARNLVDAAELIIKREKAVVSTYRINKEKALRILDGSDPAKEFDDKTSGYKTRNFYYNILEPENPDYVTIDRHIIELLKLNYPSITRKRYYDAVNAIKKYAKKAGLLPNQLQAILWETYRRVNKTLFNDMEIDVGF